VDAQARAIWPHEVQLIRRYTLPADAQILDAGCGTGEGASRLAELFPEARVLGVDIIDHHYLHLIAEDYGMVHFQRGRLDPREFWHQAPVSMGSATGTDLFIGRNTYEILAAIKLEQITVDYIIVDTLRVPRDIFAAIIKAWRDGYAETIGKLTPINHEVAVAYFNEMIANILDPQRYAVWMVPIVSAKVS
jgi:SAM-dependent methyltransferase